MKLKSNYDVAIIGGGLAGLAASILLSRSGYAVIVFEKETYPYHKVCGEYISLESYSFLESLGLPVGNMNLPIIKKLLLTAPNGNTFYTSLPQGGIGISRYTLDNRLAQIAKTNGVTLLEKTRVDEVVQQTTHTLFFNAQTITATVCLGAWGKRSNLDIKWRRVFTQATGSRLNNYIGVKYHLQTNWDKDLIGLHNFKDGYCGISKIEEDKYCCCYMTKAQNLKRSGNSLPQMEKEILYQNPHLKKILEESTILQSFPVTISQISFSKKEKVEKGVLLLGDSAGMITPLCGNGMSIALHTAKISAALVNKFLQGQISRAVMEKTYTQQWNKAFAQRIKTGRILQFFFGSLALSNVFVRLFKLFPFLARPLIKQTHGLPF